jgi:hypothetical protein
MAVKEEARKLTLRQREGRAVNAVAELLRRTLSVPNIYLEPPASLIPADILAVDRGGAGDLHAVEIKLLDKAPPPVSQSRTQPSPKEKFISLSRERAHREMVKGVHSQLMSMPAHFRYLAISSSSFDALQGDLSQLGLYAKDGIGRLGIITIVENGAASPIAEIAVTPERFRVDPAKLKAIETRLLAKSRPDIEVRI